MSEKRQARFEMLRETSKERIENAALELFAQNGYGHTSISQIAKAAGISKGLMYNYYESKEALLQSVLKRGFEFGDKLMMSNNSLENSSPEDLLKTIVEASFMEVKNNLIYWKLLMALAFQEEVIKTLAPDIEQKKTAYLSIGKTIYSQLGYPNPEAQARLFGAVMDGVFMHYILTPNEYPLDDVKQLLINNFCKNMDSE
ncbi:MAG: TetR/AcrR family transcriptional regulator [Saprospiraceae bacterium]